MTITESGEVLTKPKDEISSGSLQSTYDEDATFRRKKNFAQSSYVLEMSETCDKENTFQLITDYAVESNNGNDSEILQTDSNNREHFLEVAPYISEIFAVNRNMRTKGCCCGRVLRARKDSRTLKKRSVLQKVELSNCPFDLKLTV